MKDKLIALRESYDKIITNNDILIRDCGVSDMTGTRLLIEKHCYLKFIKQIDKILENESIGDCKTE